MGTIAQNLRDKLPYQIVYLPSEYARQVLDKNHTGLISIKQIAEDPLSVISKLAVPLLFYTHTNNTKLITNILAKEFGTSGYIDIDKQVKPLLIKGLENYTAFNLSKCSNREGCPIWLRSELSLKPTLSIIGNVSKATGILILNGENDSETPVQQAFLLQQRLSELNHLDHTLITYPNLGHLFYPASKWTGSFGPIQQYVLADLYAWLEAHSGLSHISAGTTSLAVGANASSMGTNATSSNYSKR